MGLSLSTLKLRKSAGVRVTAATHRLIAAGDRARDRRDWAEAERAYRAVLAQDPALTHIWEQLGHACAERGDRAAAIVAYREALARDTDQAVTLHRIAMLLRDEGRYVEARDAFAAALALAPGRDDLAAAAAALTVPNRSADEIVLMQTSDPSVYREMLDVSALTTVPYARRHGLRYQAFIGLTRGDRPWHATYNRIDLLADLVARDFRGWVLYMDADSWIADQAFDLRAFLAAHARYALIGAPAGNTVDLHWNVNIGVMLFNLGHPFMRRVIDLWAQNLATIDFWGPERDWMFDGLSDQSMLHGILDREPEARELLFHVDKGLINSPWASFIRQAMRAEHADVAERVAVMRASIAAGG